MRRLCGRCLVDIFGGTWTVAGQVRFFGCLLSDSCGGRRADGWFRVCKKSSSVSREPSGAVCNDYADGACGFLWRDLDGCRISALFCSLLSDSCRGRRADGWFRVCKKSSSVLRESSGAVCNVSNEYASADALPEPQAFLARQNCPLSYKSHATVLLRLGQSRRRRVVQKVFLKGERPFREKIPIVISILFGYTVVTGEI